MQLLGSTLLEERTLYQFIGEVENPTVTGRTQATVKARIARPMPGLDLTLFEKALAVRRSYLNELSA
eukprot:gene17018-17262_t